jgi:phosphoglycerol transferase
VAPHEPAAVEPETAAGPDQRRFLRGIFLDSLLVILVTAALLIPLTGIATRDLGVPFTYRSDAVFYGVVTKSLIDHGSALRNPSMGAPFGQQFYDQPQGADNVQLLALRAIGAMTHDWARTMNLYFISGFFLTALTAFWVLRTLHFSRLLSLAVAELFTFQPYHFARGTVHLLLSSYWMVPPAALLLVWSISDGDGLIDHDRETPRRWQDVFRSRRLIVAIVIAALLGSSSTYYAAFTAMLLTITVIVVALARRNVESLIPGLLLAATIAGAMALNNAPTLAFWARHGFNGVTRNLAGTEVYGLRIATLLLPTAGHRIPLFSRITSHATRNAGVPSEGGGALGVIAALGFVGLLLELFRTQVVGRTTDAARGALRSTLAVLLLVALLLSLIGGFGYVLGLGGLTWIRGWNRMSIFVAFFSLVYVATWVERCEKRRDDRGASIWPLLAAVTCVTLLGVLDQTPKEPLQSQQSIAAEYRNDRRFVAKIESSLPRDSAVFQLPIISFPEHPPVVRMTDYDLAKGYLNSRHLRWSYGAMTGREGKWLDRLSARPIQEILPAVAAAGFNGLYVDRYGYNDNANSLEANLRSILGEQPLVSGNGRLSFFDLGPYANSLRARIGDAALAQLKAETLRN